VSTAKVPGGAEENFSRRGISPALAVLEIMHARKNFWTENFSTKRMGNDRRLSRFVLGSTIMKHPASDALQDHRHGFAFPFRRDRPNGSGAPYRRPARHAPPLKLATGTRRPRAVSRSRRRRARQTPRAPR